MSVTEQLIKPHLKTLWWWQRGKVLDAVVECLERLDQCPDDPKVFEVINRLKGKSRRVLLFFSWDHLRYVQFTGNQILEGLGHSGRLD